MVQSTLSQDPRESGFHTLRRQALEAPETAEVGVYMHPVGGSARKISRLF